MWLVDGHGKSWIPEALKKFSNNILERVDARISSLDNLKSIAGGELMKGSTFEVVQNTM